MEKYGLSVFVVLGNSFRLDGPILRVLKACVFTVVAACMLVGCEKPRFAVFLVEKKDYVSRNGPNLKEVRLERSPILTDKDIVIYDWPTHSITLTQGGERRIFEYQGNKDRNSTALRGKQFVVTADGERCYGGTFYSSLTSPFLTCPMIDYYRRKQTIVIEWFGVRANDQEAPPDEQDPRLDPRVKKVLEDMGKLK